MNDAQRSDAGLPQRSLWAGNSPVQAEYEDLNSRLVGSFGPALTSHGELLRAASRIYYDLYNNGFGNGPFETEWQAIVERRDEIVEFMEWSRFREFQRAFESVHFGADVVDSQTWRGGPLLEELMQAVVKVAGKADAAMDELSRPPVTSALDLVRLIDEGSAEEREEGISFMTRLVRKLSERDDGALARAVRDMEEDTRRRSSGPRP